VLCRKLNFPKAARRIAYPQKMWPVDGYSKFSPLKQINQNWITFSTAAVINEPETSSRKCAAQPK